MLNLAIANKSIENSNKKAVNTLLARLYLSLGHFYLLVYDYNKSLIAYQKFYSLKAHRLQVNAFVLSSSLSKVYLYSIFILFWLLI
jgi:hypothetical protein